MSGERVERALRLRRILGPFFERCPVPVLVVEREGPLASANDTALAQYGYSLEELVELTVGDLMAWPRPQLSSDLEHAWRGDLQALERRPHRRKDGSVLWVIPAAGPQVLEGETLIVSVLQDVTALVSAEVKAHFEEAQVEVLWEGAVERSGGAFALLDASRRLVRVNRTMSQWLDRREEDLLGKRCDEVFLTVCQRQPCPHTIAQAERRRVVEEVTTHDGRPLRIDISLAPSNDTGIAFIHAAHDMTEERAMRTRLVAADRLASLGRVAAGVAHEVNNSAAFVMLALPLARDRVTHGRSAEALALLEEAITGTTQITEVMRDLGGVAQDRPRAVVDLSLLARSTLRMATYEAQARARLVSVLDDSVAAEVRGTRVSQVLLNLILNAVQALPVGQAEHHRIEVWVRRSGDRALLEVADTGPGVPDAIAERIFEPFFTTRSALGGTGLGLWLSRNIIEEEGGTLTFHNRPEGGAVFTVSLPLHQPTQSESRMRAG